MHELLGVVEIILTGIVSLGGLAAFISMIIMIMITIEPIKLPDDDATLKKCCYVIGSWLIAVLLLGTLTGHT